MNIVLVPKLQRKKWQTLIMDILMSWKPLYTRDAIYPEEVNASNSQVQYDEMFLVYR